MYLKYINLAHTFVAPFLFAIFDTSLYCHTFNLFWPTISSWWFTMKHIAYLVYVNQQTLLFNPPCATRYLLLANRVCRWNMQESMVLNNYYYYCYFYSANYYYYHAKWRADPFVGRKVGGGRQHYLYMHKANNERNGDKWDKCRQRKRTHWMLAAIIDIVWTMDKQTLSV